MNKRLTLADLSPRNQAEVIAQLNPVRSGPACSENGILGMSNREIAGEQKKRLRQSTKPVLNKLETRFHEKLMKDYTGPRDKIFCQAVRFELARGIWYKPDFFLPAVTPSAADPHRYRPALAYEVKGPKSFRGGFENLKVAARVHSWAKFFLVWEDEDRVWQRQEILP